MISRRVTDCHKIVRGIASVRDELNRIRKTRAFLRLIEIRKRHPSVYVSMGNDAFSEMIANCVLSLQRAGAGPIVLFLTEGLASRWSPPGCEIISLEELLKVDDVSVEYGTAGFKRLMHGKVLSVMACLMAGLDVVFSDADVVWNRAFDWEVARDFDFAFQPENRSRPAVSWAQTADSLELNAGLFAARANHRCRLFLFLVMVLRRVRPNFSDQPSMNYLYNGLRRLGWISLSPRPGGSGGRLRLLPLPMDEFPNGFYFKQGLEAGEVFPEALKAVHFNHLMDPREKVSLMMKTGRWLLRSKTS